METCLMDDALTELKMVDHLVFVSLRYTRTVDVIKSIVQRLVYTYDEFMTCILMSAKKDGTLEQIPELPALRCNKIRELFPEDEILINMVDFYQMLRKILRSKISGINEFRRHVTLIGRLDGEEWRVDIDLVNEYYKDAREHFEYLKKIKEEAQAN